MYKLLTFPGEDISGNVFVQALKPGRGMEKLASGDLHPKVRSFIDGLTKSPHKLYVLVNALGAGEFYGSNINGDFFEESELNPTIPAESRAESGYLTFMDSGIYRHHKNKDRERSMGKVVCAYYNPVMHRVELVLEIDRAKARMEGHAGLVDSLDAGGHPAVSMGCKVKYDVCSICGHKSKTRADYCIHTKTMMGKILPDGRKVFVYNPKPRFFDLSFVVIGADRTSFAMMKVASAQATVSSAAMAEEYGLTEPEDFAKVASSRKIATLIKRVPAMSASVSPKAFSREPDLPVRMLDSLAQHPLKRALTSTAASGIVLKPKEYQRIVLVRMGKRPMADNLMRRGIVFSPSSGMDRSISLGSPGDYMGSIMSMLKPMLERRSMFEPILTKRIVITIRKPAHMPPKSMSYGDSPLLNKIADGYNGYRQQLLENITSVVDNITSKDTELLQSLSESGFEDMLLGSNTLSKTASKPPLGLLGIMPLTYLYGAHVRQNEMSTGKSAGPLDSFLEQHPIVASSIFLGLARLGLGLKKGNLDAQLGTMLSRL